ETNFLVQYIGTNVPQAWAGGSVFMLTQALLGLLPDAPRNKLYVDPPLPTWLPDLTVQGLRVGKRKFDICFWREQTSFEVATGNPKLVERCDLVSKITQLRTASDRIQPITMRSDQRGYGARVGDLQQPFNYADSGC